MHGSLRYVHHFGDLVNCLNKVLEFLNAHRDTIVILLRIDLDDIPLAVVDEINLVVSICTAILPLVPKSELVRVHRMVTFLVLTIQHSSSHRLAMAVSTAPFLRWPRRHSETLRGPRASGHQPTRNLRMPLLTIQSIATKPNSGPTCNTRR
jgi:hypothetical protein